LSSGVKPFVPAGRSLYFDVPAGTMLGHPGVQGMVVILLIRTDHAETRKVVGRDVAEQEWCCHPIIEPGSWSSGRPATTPAYPPTDVACAR